MGRTPKPLTIGVHSSLWGHPSVVALREKGHTLLPVTDVISGADLVIGPNCWRIDESMLDYLELAIKGARTVKYPKKEPASENKV